MLERAARGVGYFGFGGGAGFAFALDDLDGRENFLLERLELVCAELGLMVAVLILLPSIDGGDVDIRGGKARVESIWVRVCAD